MYVILVTTMEAETQNLSFRFVLLASLSQTLSNDFSTMLFSSAFVVIANSMNKVSFVDRINKQLKQL